MGESFGAVLRGHRLAAGLTQDALAGRAGLSGKAIGALERGERRHPHRHTVEALAAALNVDLDALLSAAKRRPVPIADVSGGTSLPHVVPDFTGRAAEIECFRAIVKNDSGTVTIVVLHGMAGSGKTTLALQLAHECADEFPDGRLFVDLHGHTPDREPMSSGEALGILLRGAGVPGTDVPRDAEHRAQLWRARTSGRRLLILLDNAADAGQIRPLLPGASGHQVVITSRRRLSDVDGASHVHVQPMPPRDAAELFAKVAQREIDDHVLARLAELCGRLPLALRLAAARLRHRPCWHPRELADLLGDSEHRLAALVVGARSVANAFDLSYRGLTDRQQAMFRALGRFPGDDLEPHAAAAWCDLTVGQARQTLEELADAHLAREHAAERYVCHDLVRLHAAKIAEHDLEALRRLVEHYIAAAARAEPRWWDAERINLRAAVLAASEARLDRHAVVLAAALVPSQTRTGHAQDRYDTQSAALRSARRQGDVAATARVLVHLAAACHHLARRFDADVHYHNAITLARDAGDVATEAGALARLGALCQSIGRYREAHEHMCAALLLFDAAGDERQSAITQVALGVLYERTGRYDESLDALDQALSVLERTGPLFRLAQGYRALGVLYWRLGRIDEAEVLLTEAAGHARALRDQAGESRALLGLADVQRTRGCLAEARETLHEVLAAPRAAEIEALALTKLGAVHAALDDRHVAAELQQKALTIAITHEADDLRAVVLNDLGDSTADAGYYEQALECATAAGFELEAHRARSCLAEVLELSRNEASRRESIPRWRATT